MLFTLIINQGANNYISMENKNVRLMKTIPVNLYKQLFIKVIIPFILSSASLFVSIFYMENIKFFFPVLASKFKRMDIVKYSILLIFDYFCLIFCCQRRRG